MKWHSTTLGSRWLLGFGALSTVALAALVLLNFRSPRAPDIVAQDAIGALIEGDAARIWQDISDEEKTSLSLTEGSLSAFLEHFVAQRLNGFHAVGSPKKDAGATDRTITITQQFQHDDGRNFLLISQASPAGDNDAKLTAFVANTYLSSCWADLPPGTTPPTGLNRRMFWRSKALEYGPDLKKLGVFGFLNTSNRFYTWEQWVEHNAPR